jgi:hypothetical protein
MLLGAHMLSHKSVPQVVVPLLSLIFHDWCFCAHSMSRTASFKFLPCMSGNIWKGHLRSSIPCYSVRVCFRINWFHELWHLVVVSFSWMVLFFTFDFSHVIFEVPRMHENPSLTLWPHDPSLTQLPTTT